MPASSICMVGTDQLSVCFFRLMQRVPGEAVCALSQPDLQVVVEHIHCGRLGRGLNGELQSARRNAAIASLCDTCMYHMRCVTSSAAYGGGSRGSVQPHPCFPAARMITCRSGRVCGAGRALHRLQTTAAQRCRLICRKGSWVPAKWNEFRPICCHRLRLSNGGATCAILAFSAGPCHQLC